MSGRSPWTGLLASVLIACLCSCARHPSRLLPGTMAPALRAATVEGDTIDLTEARGRPVALIWVDPICPAVQDAVLGPLVRIERLARQTGDFQMIFVASTPRHDPDYLEPADLLGWQREHRLGAPLILDTTGTIARSFGVTRIPTAIVMGPTGVVRSRGPAEAADSAGAAWLLHAIEAARADTGVSPPMYPSTEHSSGCPLQRP